jgi:hypothetical protein
MLRAYKRLLWHITVIAGGGGCAVLIGGTFYNEYEQYMVGCGAHATWLWGYR